MKYSKRELTDVLYAISKLLCVIGGVACFGLILGTVGAVDVAGDRDVHGWILQTLLGICGMGFFIWLSGKLD